MALTTAADGYALTWVNSQYGIVGVDMGTGNLVCGTSAITTSGSSDYAYKVKIASYYDTTASPWNVTYTITENPKPLSFISKISIRMNTETTGVVQEMRDLALDEGDQVLREVGLKNKAGRWTEDAIILWLEQQMDKEKSALVEKAKALVERRKEKRKAKKEGECC